MRLSRFTDYSLRTLLYVAMHQDRRVTIGMVADAFGISANHLTKVVHHLGKVGMLANTRGRKGGLSLALEPSAIRVGDLVRLTEEPDFMAECFEAGGTCPIASACLIRPVLSEALASFYQSLNRYTLADVSRNQSSIIKLLPEAVH